MKRTSYKKISSRKRTRGVHVFFKISAVFLTAFVIVAVLAVLNPKFLQKPLAGEPSSSSQAASDESAPPSHAPEVSSVAPDAQSNAQPQVTSQPQSGENNYADDPVEGAVPQSPKAPESYFDDAAFIGDSRTEGLMMYAGPENADYLTAKGLNVESAFDKPAVNVGGKKVSVVEALRQGSYGKVYLMLGVNELGWAYSELFIKRYGELVEAVRQAQPNAEIYVQSILPVSKEKSDSDDIYNNGNIKKYNALIEKMAREKKVHYLNVKEAIEDANLCLPDEASTDGVHLNAEYCKKWMDYLRTHTAGTKG